jgi:hypothetical protein
MIVSGKEDLIYVSICLQWESPINASLMFVVGWLWDEESWISGVSELRIAKALLAAFLNRAL